MIRTALLPALALGASLAACDDERGVDLERMKDQYRYDPYEENRWFADRRSMRDPPSETVSRERAVASGPVATGADGDLYVAEVPVPVDRALLERGRDRYDIFCAVCHGHEGDGRSQVAENMQLRKPPAFDDPQVSELPVGKIFSVITRGYGLMPAYARYLPERDRWAVTAYVDVLRLRRLGAGGEQEPR